MYDICAVYRFEGAQSLVDEVLKETDAVLCQAKINNGTERANVLGSDHR